MLRAMTADAVFIAAVIMETLAALSLLQSTHAVLLREEFEPVLGFYRAHLAPFFALGANLVSPGGPQWYADASILASVLFFLFFIAQARNAMAPFEDVHSPSQDSGNRERLEATIDWALPAVMCALGALLLAPTLLALLTLPAALVLAIRKGTGHCSWFEVCRSYYVNLACLVIALGGILVERI